MQAKAAFKDGNKDYKEENFKRAIENYERAVELDPNLAEAWFYLGSSHQALYRPGKDTPENKEHLEKAIEDYKKSLETNQARPSNQKKVKRQHAGRADRHLRRRPLQGLRRGPEVRAAARAGQPERRQEPLRDGEPLREVRQDRRGGGDVQEGRGAEPQRPQGLRRPGRLLQQAALGRTRRAARKFDQAIDILAALRAASTPNDAGGYQKVATLLLGQGLPRPAAHRRAEGAYADKGLEAVDKALELKPDYFEAVIYKGLLYRVKARWPRTRGCASEYLDQAQTLQKQGLELKKQTDAAAAAAAAPLAPASPGH